MTKNQNIASFMLRFTQELWQDLQGEPHIRWRGHIRHVQGNEEERFTDFAEAVAFIQKYLTKLTMDSLSGEREPVSQEKVFHENFKLWEKFTQSYTDMMLQTMENTIKKSETFKEQMDEAALKAFKAWQIPVQSDQDKLVDTLNLLQKQIQILTLKVESLEKELKQEKSQD